MHHPTAGSRRLTLSLLSATALILAGCEANRATGPRQQPSLTSLAGVMQIQNRHTPQLLALPGVVGTATGIGVAGKPVVYVLARAADVTGVPAALEGATVQVVVTGEFRALQGVSPRAGNAGAVLKKRVRPVPNGVSVSNNNECAAGTLGAAVIIGGQQYALSNNHVFARENAAAIGEPVVQPGRYDNKPKCANHLATDQLGTLADFQPIDFSPGGSNTIDAAVAVATTPLTCATPSGFYGSPSATPVVPSVGLAVEKVGRTSALTTGTITMINATVRDIAYSTGAATFTGQIVTTQGFSRPGDSGSLVVTNDGTARPVGLLFAGTNDGTTIVNPIGPVLQRFGATICHV
jgi:hypothetical protein